MKKILATVLILSLVLSLVPVAYASDSTAIDTDMEDRIFGLGLMPHVTKANYSPDTAITRGELALILDTICNYRTKTEKADFTWQFYGDALKDVNDLKDVPAQRVLRYVDVPETHWAYGVINSVSDRHLMNGVSATEFLPDGTLTIEQIAKTMVALLGYEALADYHGGYPAGYMRVAGNLGILDGVSSNGAVTNAVLMRILDNCLDVRLMAIDGVVAEDGGNSLVSTSSEETFLTELLGLNVIEGMMEDNSVTGLIEPSRLEKNQFIIDGRLLEALPDMAAALYDYIGRDVECYYVSDPASDKYGSIVYACVSGYDKAIVIEAEDFAGYSNGKITYYDGDKSKDVSLTSLFSLIYNGRVLTSYSRDIFDFEDGTITVVKTGTDMDVVIIRDYETWYVSTVDYENGKIFNRIASSLTAGTIDLEEYDFVSVTKADGSEGTLEDIEAGMTMGVVRNDNFISIALSREVVTGTIEQISNHSGNTYYLVGGQEYVCSRAYNSFPDKNAMAIGTEVTLHLNTFGKIAWVTEGVALACKVGYVMNFDNGYNGFDGNTAFMIYDTTEKKALTIYANKDKIKVSDHRGRETMYSDYNRFEADHGAYRGIVRYTTNEEGYLNYIEYPITDLNDAKDNKLMFFANIDGEEFNNNNLGGKAIINSSGVVISVDTAKADDEDSYSVSSATSVYTTKDVKYDALCYTTRKNSKLAQYIVRETESKTAAIRFSYTSALKMAIVKKITSTYDEDAGVMDTIKAFTFTSVTRNEPEDNVDLRLKPGYTVKTIMSHEFSHELSPGDIIAYGTDLDGYVTEIRVIWDESEPNPDSPTGISGMLTDSKGYYGADDEAPKFNPNNYRYEGDTTAMPNPYTIETIDGVDYGKNSSMFDTGPFCIYYGFSPRVMDGVLELTTQDLTVEEFDEYGVGGRHLLRVWGLPTNTLVVNLSGKGNVQAMYTSTNTVLDQIRTQEYCKTDCSRIITQTNAGAMVRLIVINGTFDR